MYREENIPISINSFIIYTSILINYPDCVQCSLHAIINPITFLLKADFFFLIDDSVLKLHNGQTLVQIHSKTEDQIFHVLVKERNENSSVWIEYFCEIR